jgi:hypothetical protein
MAAQDESRNRNKALRASVGTSLVEILRVIAICSHPRLPLFKVRRAALCRPFILGDKNHTDNEREGEHNKPPAKRHYIPNSPVLTGSYKPTAYRIPPPIMKGWHKDRAAEHQRRAGYGQKRDADRDLVRDKADRGVRFTSHKIEL